MFLPVSNNHNYKMTRLANGQKNKIFFFYDPLVVSSRLSAFKESKTITAPPIIKDPVSMSTSQSSILRKAMLDVTNTEVIGQLILFFRRVSLMWAGVLPAFAFAFILDFQSEKLIFMYTEHVANRALIMFVVVFTSLLVWFIISLG